MDETVYQSAGSRLEAPHSRPRGKGAEEAVDGMGGVTRNTECFTGQVCVVDVLDGEMEGTDDLLSCSRYALQGFLVGCGEAVVPHSDAAGQNALVVPQYKVDMMDTGALALLSLWRKSRCC